MTRLITRPRAATLIIAAAWLAGAISLVSGPAQAASSGITVQAWLTTADGSSALTQQPAITLGQVTRGQVNVSVDDSRAYQTISGFGAAFTDSSTYLMAQLKSSSPAAYATMMSQLFSSSGTGLAFWRVPMGSSDFNSTNNPWTDDDTQGPSSNPTQNFGLTPMDTGHIIPVLKDALATNPGLKIFATPWSPPAWMKSNGSMICNTGSGNSSLMSQYYQAYADYFVKWIQAYQANGVPIWAVTPQNEPLYCPANYPGSSWDPASEANWVQNYLEPDLASAGLTTKVLGYDHNWDALWFPQQLLSDSAAGAFAGIAWHCYDYNSDPTMGSVIHNEYSGIDQYETECSSDTGPTNLTPYTTSSMTALAIQNWAKGVELWNVALDSNDGPHLGGCPNCVPLVTINTGGYTLDNIYYQLGQFSKFVDVGATHIASTVNAHGVITAAFRDPDGQEVLVATNPGSSAATFEVTWNGQGSFAYTLPSEATVTFRGSVPAAPAKPSTPAAGLTYRLVNRATGKSIGVYGASTADGAQIVQWTDDNDPDQQWTLASAGNGYYNIVNVNSGKALDDTNGSTTNGTQMQQWTTGTGNSNQQWQITPLGNGSYTITNRTSGLVLDLTNGAFSDGTPIQQWQPGPGNPNQQWELVPVR
ncbi:MAG TPA: RICIN domain-containing protein [Streptosporangiaceae bacterium]|nr:RICIN domain-containing protein [Streptosporangiaceae bacterium]